MFCRHCGKEINDDEIYCPFCGIKLQRCEGDNYKESAFAGEENTPNGADQNKNEKQKNSKIIVSAIVIAAVVVVGAIIVFSLLSKSEQDNEAIDKTPPEITIKQNTINEGETFDIGDFISVSDDVDGSINKKDIEVEGNVNTEVAGTYELTVSATDSAGNKATKNLTVEVIRQQGSKTEFIRKISGLWLNGCQSAADAKSSAHDVGLMDVSMTEFIANGEQCVMSTIGDITGEYDGDTVPDITDGVINFSYISPDLCTAKGTVDGMEISFDLGASNDQVIMYECDGYYTHCAYTGFSTENEMNEYLYNLYE